MRRGNAGRRGQALVELAAAATLLILLALGAVQFGIVYSAKCKVTHAAREGARYASLHASGSDAEIQAHAAQAAPDLDPPLAPGDVAIATPGPDGRLNGQPIVVTVTYTGARRLPIVEAMLPDPLTIRAAVTMRIEQ